VSELKQLGVLNHSGRWRGWPYDSWTCCDTSLETCPKAVRVGRSKDTPSRNKLVSSTSSSMGQQLQHQMIKSHRRHSFSGAGASVSIQRASTESLPLRRSQSQPRPPRLRDDLVLKLGGKHSTTESFSLRSSQNFPPRMLNRTAPAELVSRKCLPRGGPKQLDGQSETSVGFDQARSSKKNDNNAGNSRSELVRAAAGDDQQRHKTVSDRPNRPPNRQRLVSRREAPPPVTKSELPRNQRLVGSASIVDTAAIEQYEHLRQQLVLFQKQNAENFSKINENFSKVDNQQTFIHSKVLAAEKKLKLTGEKLVQTAITADVALRTQNINIRTASDPVPRVKIWRSPGLNNASIKQDDNVLIRTLNPVVGQTFQDRLDQSVQKFHSVKGYHGSTTKDTRTKPDRRAHQSKTQISTDTWNSLREAVLMPSNAAVTTTMSATSDSDMLPASSARRNSTLRSIEQDDDMDEWLNTIRRKKQQAIQKGFNSADASRSACSLCTSCGRTCTSCGR
jgi:hypothetical protein